MSPHPIFYASPHDADRCVYRRAIHAARPLPQTENHTPNIHGECMYRCSTHDHDVLPPTGQVLGILVIYLVTVFSSDLPPQLNDVEVCTEGITSNLQAKDYSGVYSYSSLDIHYHHQWLLLLLSLLILHAWYAPELVLSSLFIRIRISITITGWLSIIRHEQTANYEFSAIKT